MPICSHMVKRSARNTLRDTSMTLSSASARRECRSTGVPGAISSWSASSGVGASALSESSAQVARS